jgi:antitoxin (DNA-binding transcriptional repressor) of toxin-antitoxin stability system
METIGAKRLRRHWPQILDELRPEGVVITRHGRPVAVLRRTNGDLIGIIEEDIRVDPADNLFSTGAWVSDEWADLNDG